MPMAFPLTNGSQWRRWDPHIHTPGTLLSDHFDNDWDGYLTKLETSTPRIEALGITDYFSLDTYKEVLKHKANGRLPDVGLIFPNVEMRLTVDTEKKKAINAHLLFCPDDDDHIEQIERALQQLTFSSNGVFHCTRADLIRLGRSRLGSGTAELAALKEGANQFKVTFDQIKKAYNDTPWMKTNCLIAVSGSSNDGTAGLGADGSFAALREEIERTSHVVFSATESTRHFWLGRRDGFTRDHIENTYGCLKPCIHGSDAHRVERTASPDLNRYCWIKGDATFEALRQVVLEPDARVHIGEEPPHRIDTGDFIKQVVTTNTHWMKQNEIELNPGLVAIIGARGSGKTALADIIARAASADHAQSNRKSFLFRAAAHLTTATVELHWDQSPVSNGSLWTDTESEPDPFALPTGEEQVRYLSQQFVERLCSSTSLHPELIDEIERVIFNETKPTEHLDCDSFQQLSDFLLEPIRGTRRDLQETIADISTQIVTEEGLIENLQRLGNAVTAADKKVKDTEKQMTGLLPKGDAIRSGKLTQLEGLYSTLSTTVDKEKRRLQRLQDLRTEIGNFRKIQAPQVLDKLKGRFPELVMPNTDWNQFLLDYVGNVENVIKKHEASTQETINTLSTTDPTKADAIPGLAPNKWPLDYLEKQKKLLENQVGIDTKNKTKYTALQGQLELDNRALQRAKEAHDHAKGAQARRDVLTQKRKDHYHECIQTYIDETTRLEQLYSPLHESFAKETGTITRLRFSVTRNVDLEAWIKAGKEHFDLRMESNLRGHHGLHEAAKKSVYRAWMSGNADAVSAAMAEFIKNNIQEILKLKPPSIKSTVEVGAWKQRVAAWHYNTDHISLSYSMTYDNVPIERLSPGTRGIVLLLLYLVIDKKDKRPLLIDQPEENLDPRSVYEELVAVFREARKRRQVIIVTHNANLVVNADADQVIVATPSPNTAGGLPTIDYDSGSLENPRIRKAVCQILEGGERAFLDRERRYRLQRKPGVLVS